MSSSSPVPTIFPAKLPWDECLARALVRPLRDGPVTHIHPTTLRLTFGVGAAIAFTCSSYGWLSLGALL